MGTERFHGINFSINSELERYRAESLLVKEPETIFWLDQWSERLSTEKIVFFDIGANIGVFSLYIASKIASRCEVYAFEPESKNYTSLCQNIAVNSELCIHPMRLALGNTRGLAKLLVNDSRFGNSGAQLLDLGSETKSETVIREELVLAESLDSLIRDYNFPSPNLIKIDVDGIESKILDGMKNTLNSVESLGVIVEFNNQEELNQWSGKLEEFGFYPDTTVNDLPTHSNVRRRMDPNNVAQNFAFIR